MMFDFGKYQFLFRFDRGCCYYMKHNVCPLDDRSIPSDGITISGGVDYCRQLESYIATCNSEKLNALLVQEGDLAICINSCNYVETNHQHRTCVLAHMKKNIKISGENILQSSSCKACGQEVEEEYLIYSPISNEYDIKKPNIQMKKSDNLAYGFLGYKNTFIRNFDITKDYFIEKIKQIQKNR